MTPDPQCDQCGRPAQFIGEDGILVCGDCACWQRAYRQGERYQLLHALDFAVSRLRMTGMTPAEIRAALEEALAEDQPPTAQLAREEHGAAKWGLDELVALDAADGGPR